MANHKVFDAFYSDDDRLALMHGPTFMGNPLACAVALKGIEIFEREDYMSKIRHIEQVSRGEMEAFTDPRIKEVRIMGGCVCVEVHDSRDLEGFQQFIRLHRQSISRSSEWAEFPAQRMQLSLFLQEPAQYLWVRQISTIRQ